MIRGLVGAEMLRGSQIRGIHVVVFCQSRECSCRSRAKFFIIEERGMEKSHHIPGA
jgi:hypothetical protein